MPRLASLEDLEAFLGRDLEEAKREQAELALDLATGAIQSEIRQHLFFVEGDAITLNGRGRRRLFLPELPVVDVTAIEEDGTALEVDADYLWDEFGILERYPSDVRWAAGQGIIAVTYDHGYAEVPGIARSVCLAVAARTITNPEGLPREAVEGYQPTYAQVSFNAGASIHLLENEKRDLDPLRP